MKCMNPSCNADAGDYPRCSPCQAAYIKSEFPGKCERCGGPCRARFPICKRCFIASEGSAAPTPGVFDLAPRAGSLVCRDHHDQVVRRDGRGCARCKAERMVGGRG